MKKFAMMFEDIKDARSAFCGRVENVCDKCPLSRANNGKGIICLYFVRDYPEKAAELMDLEAIEEEGKPKLTEQELAICKLVGAKWVSRDGTHPGWENVCLWISKPEYQEKTYCGADLDDDIATFSTDYFPSLEPGDLVNVEEMIE